MEMKHFTIILLLLSSFASAQTTVTWDWLQQQVYMVEAFDLASRQRVQRPRFLKDLRKLDGKQITIEGYVLPLDVDGQSYALSANPYAACFFCGGAGPESVIALWFDGPAPRRYKIDERARFTGRLVLNETYDGYVYLLQGAIEE
jgi:hypothetical protein